MSSEEHYSFKRQFGRVGSVTSGLNLWLELEDPSKMNDLLLALAADQTAIDQALNSLNYVHFARFVPTPDSKALQVITAFDGELSAYVLDFVLAIGDQFNLILEHIKDRPPLPVQNYPTQFLNFVINNNLGERSRGGRDVGLFSAYPRKTVIDITGPEGIAPAPVERELVAVNRSDVQANTLRGVRAKFSCNIALRFGSSSGARGILQELLNGTNGIPKISTDASWINNADRPNCVLTVGLTFSGLLALNIDKDDELAFRQSHKSFVAGPDRRETAVAVGDVGPSAPDNWELGGANAVDMVVSIFADDEEMLNSKKNTFLARFGEYKLKKVGEWALNKLPHNGDPKLNLVHFGYFDGLSQPRLAIEGARDGNFDGQPSASVGEFLLGENYPNVFGGKNSMGGLSKKLAQNGTFAAMRMVEQNVVEFESLLDRASAEYSVDREWIAAKLMGRWRDGTPLAHSPDSTTGQLDNNFDYRPRKDKTDIYDDSDGYRCPIGAHVRRMNPRSAKVAGRPHSRRLLRRGMPYGPLYNPEAKNDGEKRGLFGVFICADLERQFEFILGQWGQGDRATNGLGGQQDPIVGAQHTLDDDFPMSGNFHIQRPGGLGDIVLKMPRLLTTVGSVYLFMPGIEAIRSLAAPENISIAANPHAGGAMSPTNTTGFTDRDLGAMVDPTTFDPRGKEFRDNPFPVYKWFRENAPVVYLPMMNSVWVFDHENVEAIARHPELFLKRNSASRFPAGLLKMDPPAHTGCRKEIVTIFADVLADVRPDISPIVQKYYYKNCENRGRYEPVDWVNQFAVPVAREVFFNVFGLPFDQATETAKRVEGILTLASPEDDAYVKLEVGQRIASLSKFLFKISRIKSFTPGRLLDRILKMTQLYDKGSNQNLEIEQISNAATFTMSGLLTTQWFIAVAVWRLLEEKGKRLKQLQEDASITDRDVVDELLRFDMITPFSDRYAAENTQIAGVEIAKDQRLTLVFSSANHDEKIFGSDAGTIDFKRKSPAGPGLAFGEKSGNRSCVGEPLIYLVMEAVVRMLRETDPNHLPRLAEGFQPAWGPYSERALFRSMAALPVHS